MGTIILFATIVFVILGILEWRIRFIREHQREVIFLVVIGMLISIIYLRKIWSGEYNLSFTNLMYAMAPFNNVGVGYSGPLLSDPMDATLPYLYMIFQKFQNVSWTSSVAFGSPISPMYILNPINYVYLLGMEYGQLLEFLIQYSLAFLGMYLFLRNNKYNKYSACAGAITFMFSSAMVMWGGWPHSTVVAYAPFLFLIVDRLMVMYCDKSNKNKITYYILFSIVVYLMLVAGMPTYVAYYMYLGIVYTIFRLMVSFDIRKEYKTMFTFLITIGIAIVIGALLAAPYILDLYSQVSEYSEGRSAYAFSTLNFEYIRGFLFPYYSGESSMHLNECSVYSGLTFLFFFVIAPLYYRVLEKKKKQDMLFWGMAFIAIMLIIFTKNTGYLYQYIPLINTSLKYRCITLLNFVCGMLACITVQCISEYKIGKKSFYILILPVATYIYAKQYIVSVQEQKVLAYLVLLAIVIVIIANIKKLTLKNLMVGFLMLLIVCDSAVFAREYIPLVESGVSVVPEANSSVDYLQDNMGDGERVAALGNWTLFPASNIFYDIDVITGHGFINTNEDIINYLTTINIDAGITSTKTALLNIDNYELLSYASIKYIYESAGSLALVTQTLEEMGTERNPVAFYGNGELIQQFVATDDDFYSIDILFSTYGQELSENDTLHISVLDESANVLHEESLSLNVLEDNSFYTVILDESIVSAEGKTFYIKLSAEEEFKLPLAIWISSETIYEGELNFASDYAGDLIFVDYYQMGENVVCLDNMIITEMSEYSPRVFIATDYIETETLEETLQIMSEDYYEYTVIATNEVLSKYELSTEESVEKNEILSYIDNNDEVTIELTTTGKNMLVLTDYYCNGWRAYIDGEAVEIEKVNYLFRGIYLEDEGEYTVEFIYEPLILKMSYLIMGVTILVLLIIFLFKDKLNRILDAVYIDRKDGEKSRD